jgi:hypothetical protein
MRWVPAPFEIAATAILSILGLLMLYVGTTNQQTGVLISGALCLPLGATTLVVAVRNALWHRRMMRESNWNHGTESD